LINKPGPAAFDAKTRYRRPAFLLWRLHFVNDVNISELKTRRDTTCRPVRTSETIFLNLCSTSRNKQRVPTPKETKSMFHMKRLSAAVLGGFLLAGSVMPSMASNCEERVRKAEEKMRHEEERHGRNSSQAEHARHDLEREKANCRADHHDHHDDHHDDHRY
jgi:hypothetical protein